MILGGGIFIRPPLLGIKAADSWDVVAIAFGISGVLIPLMGIIAQAKIQGTVIDFGKKVHPVFALVIGILIYGICLFFPIPRTVSVAYENELGRVANGKNKAKVAGTNADYFNIRGEKDDRAGNVKADLNIGVDNQRIGVTANVGYDTKGHNVRGGVGLRVIF